MMGYKLTTIARQDIRNINRYSISHWGKAKAIQYVSALYERFEWLSNQPHMGRNRDYISASLLSYQEGSHVIFYRREPQGHISILRVLHQRMDFKRHLQI